MRLHSMYQHATSVTSPYPNHLTLFSKTGKADIQYSHETKAFKVPSVSGMEFTEQEALVKAGWVQDA